MDKRERIDAVIVITLFSALLGASDAFSILINQVFAPVGYSSDESGIFGAVLIFIGIIGAGIAAPIFDRYLTHHLALAVRVLIPILAACYIALIWDVRPNNSAGIYVVMVVIGISSFVLLPIALELGCEITRSAEVSSAVLWFSGNLFAVVFVLVEGALRAPETADPPSNMRGALIFQASLVAACCLTVVGLRGKQSRRELDVNKREEAESRFGPL